MPAKYKYVAEQLRSELRDNAGTGGYKLPTERELTERYQVSRQTVRHALQLLTEEGLIERRQGSGSYALAKPSECDCRQIAVVTSFLDDYIFPTILHDVQGVFAQNGYSVLVYATENRVSTEREILLELMEQSISGILVEGSKTALPNPNSDLYQKLYQSGVPILFLHAAYGDLAGFPCVSDDNYGGGYQLTRYLIGRGHREIAGIFKSDDVQGPQRYHGCISALRDAGLTISDRRFNWYDSEDRQEMLEKKRSDLLRLFLTERLENATAVVCYNDEIAFLLIREALALGWKVPEDLAVVSFDNSYYSRIGPVRITSLRHKGSRTGLVAAEQLIQILKGGKGTSTVLDWELVARDSG